MHFERTKDIFAEHSFLISYMMHRSSGLIHKSCICRAGKFSYVVFYDLKRVVCENKNADMNTRAVKRTFVPGIWYTMILLLIYA